MDLNEAAPACSTSQTNPNAIVPIRGPAGIAPKLCYSNGFVEKIEWRDPLRGPIDLTDKEKADALAIGGMRDAAASLEKLTYSAEFGD